MFHVKQSQVDKLERYSSLVHRYHAALDLVSEAALHDLLRLIEESLKYLELLGQPTDAPLLDLGSGVGMPGIPLAITLPERPIFLVERRSRRSTFLKLAVSQLKLDNATVYSKDVRSLASPPVQTVTAQGVGSFLNIYCLTRHLHTDKVVLIARKGEEWQDEAEELYTALASSPLEGIELQPHREQSLEPHGKLVSLTLTGGLPCPSSASSTKRVV